MLTKKDDRYFYKDMEIVRDNPTFYLIIGYTYSHHIKIRSIVFQMEPWVYDTNKNWGVKTWGEWSIPDISKYLYILRHVNKLNPAQWFTTVPECINDKKYDKIIAILSYKAYDTGHINRINFIRYVEDKGRDIIDIYGKENYFNFRNYKGKVINKSIINDYKYILSAENNNEHNYATEKIWESFINNCLCFYDGCPNLSDYISPMSYIPIDLTKQEETLNTILNALTDDLWQQRLKYITEAKHLTINKYNLFEVLYKIIN